MKYIILILALVFSAPVFAQESQTTSQELTAELAKMTDAEKAEALKAIRAKESPAAASAREWVAIGNGLGEGLAATAQKLGVVANDFAKSPVGKMAMLLIIWNYMGNDIAGIVCSIMWLSIMLSFWTHHFRKTFGIFNEKGKFLHYDKGMFNDNSNYGTILAIYVAAIIAIITVGIVFAA